MAYKLIEAAQSRRRAVNASAASLPTTPGRARLCWREIRERHTRRMPRHRIQFKSAIEVLILAPADVLFDPLLPFNGELGDAVMPVPVCRLPDVHGLGAPFEETPDPVGQLAGVECLGGDVVGGVGLFVVVGDDAAHELGGLAAAAAAGHVHTGVG
jgi:hypothetical protein